jgi:hypothetical protein
LPTQPHDLLPYDLVEMVSGYVLACVVSERAVELVLELQLSLHRGLRGSLVQQVIAPLVAAKQRLSWARLLCTRSHRSSSAGQDYSAAVADLALPTQPHDLLPYDLVEMVSGYVLACVVSERAVELVLEYRRGECLEYRHVGLDAFGDSAVFHSCQATAICTARS